MKVAGTAVVPRGWRGLHPSGNLPERVESPVIKGIKCRGLFRRGLYARVTCVACTIQLQTILGFHATNATCLLQITGTDEILENSSYDRPFAVARIISYVFVKAKAGHSKY